MVNGKVGTQTQVIQALILESPFLCKKVRFLENGFLLPRTVQDQIY